MTNEQLIKFIQECRKQKMKDGDIMKDLLSHGWPIGIIQEGFDYLNRSTVQNQSLSLKPNTTTSKIIMDQLQPDKSISKKNNLKYIFFSIIIILFFIFFGLSYLFLSKPASNNITVVEMQKIAENISPYIPGGYSIFYKARLVKFPSGGILFETRLVNGENKIGIIILPSKTLECTSSLQKIGNKNVCIYQTSSSKSIKWIDKKIRYEVITGSSNVLFEDLEKITKSL